MSRIVRTYSATNAPGDGAPGGEEKQVDRGGATHAEVEAGQAAEAARRQTEHDGAHAVPHPIEHDVDGVLDTRAREACGIGRYSSSYVALSTENRSPWSIALVISTVQKTGNSRMENAPRLSAAGRSMMVNATPNRRSAVPVSVSCTMKLMMPSAKLKVPKNRVSAPASPPNR